MVNILLVVFYQLKAYLYAFKHSYKMFFWKPYLVITNNCKSHENSLVSQIR